ncbi:embryonic protein UVS.2-like [Ambystoma mexicanum]|uniref:embryonic protein UVS.2-like n=1 Tax=Ambystoma mexicanum TaxID=8296 RepID=UPI0037E994AE
MTMMTIIVNFTFIVLVDIFLKYDAERAIFTTALQEYATLTCVDFVTRTNEKDYLDIVSDVGCWSYIGKIGGRQEVTISKGVCIVQGGVQHELMHALGFYHEHTRKDRDNYVDIMWQYISTGDINNFQIATNGNLLGLPYDYASVMHYARNLFSNTSGQDTIIPKPDRKVPIGQRYGLSQLDVAKINKQYSCKMASTVKWLEENFPRNEMSDDNISNDTCSILFSATNGTFNTDNSLPLTRATKNCVWLIRVPNYKVLTSITALAEQPSCNCTPNYLRVYDGNSNKSPLLFRNDYGQVNYIVLTSSGKSMLLEMDTSSGVFHVEYNTVKCGGTFTDRSGTVTSENYPYSYFPLSYCVWTIIAPIGVTIMLQIKDLVLEINVNCTWDSLSIYDDENLTQPLFGNYCTKPTQRFTSSKNTLRLAFHSDGTREYRGFLATYQFVLSQWSSNLERLQMRLVIITLCPPHQEYRCVPSS